jgi:hypothetical protein
VLALAVVVEVIWWTLASTPLLLVSYATRIAYILHTIITGNASKITNVSHI